jgi:hypothetical protein
LVNGPDPVYEKTYSEYTLCPKTRTENKLTRAEKVAERNEAYYAKFPEDAERVKKIYQYLQQNKPRLPSGVLTPERFQQIGINFGASGRSI